MAIKIIFDSQHNVISPTFVLATRSGRKLGAIPAVNITASDSFNSKFDLEFEVHKSDNGVPYPLWNKLTDFSIIWCKEWDVWFQAEVTIQEGDSSVKQVSCTSLGEAELSQVYLYGQEYNTEDDIARDDYIPTHLYDAENPSASLLTRIMEKVPHYSIIHVDDRIASIQRIFSFDNKSIYDAFQEIAEEIDCIFVVNSGSNSDGTIQRGVSVYDLESYCSSCHKRGIFDRKCSECGSTDILPGYGEDTAILISADNLAEEISLKTDTGSVKNCFRLECGDDLMTATVRNCNPNGSQNIWYISDETKEDMSDELVERLESYDASYTYYNEEHAVSLTATTVSAYNALIEKYDHTHAKFSPITSSIVGYPNLMNRYYDTISFYLYLHDELMPSIEMETKTASTELALLTSANIPSVAVQNLESCSLSTVTSAVITVAKSMIDSSFKVAASNTSYNSQTKKWKGKFTVTNRSDEEQSATSQNNVEITITDDYATYVKQRIDGILKKESDSKKLIGIENLFDLSVSFNTFKSELTKYCFTSLNELHDSCEACINLLIEQGVADKTTWGEGTGTSLYSNLYKPYYDRLIAIQAEIQLRESEIKIITDLQSEIEEQRNEIQDALNFENYLGTELWLEFIAYRREDTYKNENYISDGLSDAELFKSAQEFIEIAKKEIFKSATKQHSLTATLRNLLVMREFEPIVNMFSVGNWIRVKIDGAIYKLRLISYTIDFDNLDNLIVEFSDVKKCVDGITDSASIMSKAASMASSYGGVKRQASMGQKSENTINGWSTDGMSLGEMKIVNDSDNQNIQYDRHGFIVREYDEATGSYSDRQMKIINRGIYITDDNWETCRSAVGYFAYTSPSDGETKYAYGINGEGIVGKLLLGEQLGLYNNMGNMTFDENGLAVTNGNKTVAINPNDSNGLIFKITNGDTVLLSFNQSTGKLNIVGDITAKALVLDGVKISTDDINGLTAVATSGSYNDLSDTPAPVDISGKFDNPTNNASATAGQILTKGSSGSSWESVLTTVTENSTSLVDSQAVFSYALAKNQGVGNAGTLLYVSNDGSVVPLSVPDLKALLGIS